jgi:hypothetical protein
MAIKHLNYLDIPVELRKQAAAKAKAELTAHLSNPMYTDEQRAMVSARMAKLSQWAEGKIPLPDKKD